MHLKRAHAMSHATNILNYNFCELNHLGLVCKLFIALTSRDSIEPLILLLCLTGIMKGFHLDKSSPFPVRWTQQTRERMTTSLSWWIINALSQGFR